MSGVNVTLHSEFGKTLSKVDGSIKSKVYDLLTKLSVDADLTGLDYKMPKGAGDRRIRTARVDDNFRAVMFEVDHDGVRQVFLATVLPHDDAYTWATRATLRVNPASGALEIRVLDPASAPTVTATAHRPIPPAVEDERAVLLPWSVAELIDLGIDEAAARQVAGIRHETELVDIAATLPAWQGSALIELATGTSLADVRATHELEPVDPDAADTDEAISTALTRASSRMDFAVLTDDADVRRVLDSDFAAWRLFLHPTQRAVAYRPSYNGSFRLTGGAGTGKTVVAIHRAVALARRGDDVRVLVCTFNRTLAEQLKEDVVTLAGPDVAAHITVDTVDRMARTIVTRLTGRSAKPIQDLDDEKVWEDARDTAGTAATLSGRFFKDEYEHVVLANRLTTEAEYLGVARRGRGVRLSRDERREVWSVIAAYRGLIAADGRATFQQLTTEATDAMRRHPGDVTFDHVIVDEGQDLKPASWLLLRELVVPGPDDLFICADAHQRLYGQRLVLSRLGIETRGRSRRLTLNYRTTAQILRTAVAVLHGEPVSDLDGGQDSTDGYRSLLSGGAPRFEPCSSPAEELATIVDTVRAWLAESRTDRPPSPGEVGILARRRRDAEKLAATLQGAGVRARFVEQSLRGAAEPVHVMTMHRAKGQEFRHVIVAHVTKSRLPEPNALSAVAPEDRDDVRARERFLLYVACTRARDELVVTWHGAPSAFLDGILDTAADNAVVGGPPPT